MIKFLLIGLLKDRSRSTFPVLIVASGVFLTVLLHAWINGALPGIMETNARFEAGHVKVMTRAYYDKMHLRPNDLALGNVTALLRDLQARYPDTSWHPRIKFGGLLDIPDENGETIAQGPVAGIALDILNGKSGEIDNLGLREALASGRLPQKPGEILVSDKLFKNLQLKAGSPATLISSSMEGGMAVYNFTIVGTIVFGVSALDRGAMIADVSDLQAALYMDDAASEIVGFLGSGNFDSNTATAIKDSFNASQAGKTSPYTPQMVTLAEQSDFGAYLAMVGSVMFIIIGTFVLTMGMVLWNAGLRNGIRRYGEFGLRLAVGETTTHVYSTLVIEAIIIGIIGSIVGTAIGLIPAYLLQVYGFDFGSTMDQVQSTLMMPSKVHAQITSGTYVIGFIPGILATVLGALIAGTAIFRRQTAELFKELEV